MLNACVFIFSLKYPDEAKLSCLNYINLLILILYLLIGRSLG